MGDGKTGVAHDHHLRGLMHRGAFGPEADPASVQPASIDLSLADEAFEVAASFLPNGRTIRDALGTCALRVRPEEDGSYLLDVDRIYLFRLRETLSLLEDETARFNPKSSTGRCDVFARVVVDRGRHFDLAGPGASGELWLEIVPRSFPVVVRPGTRLSQMRIQTGAESALPDESISGRSEFDGCTTRRGLELTVDLSPCRDGICGWVARTGREFAPIDMDVPLSVDPGDYFEPVPSGTSLVLVPSRFYILRSCENVVVPEDLACEMEFADTAAGEFRAHYAGFFDPGFGLTRPSRAVLEIRARDVPFSIETGQVVGRLTYHPMLGRPERAYGSGMGSNYDGQGLRLSKHFRPGGTEAPEPAALERSIET